MAPPVPSLSPPPPPYEASSTPLLPLRLFTGSLELSLLVVVFLLVVEVANMWVFAVKDAVLLKVVWLALVMILVAGEEVVMVVAMLELSR